MFDSNEATKERVSSYVAALEHERQGYEARQAAVKAGHLDRLDEPQLALRVKDVAAEIARCKKLKSKDKSEAAA